MPVTKKRTTPQPDPTKGDLAEHHMPQEQEFRQHLRALAVSAVRVLIEQVMCEELVLTTTSIMRPTVAK